MSDSLEASMMKRIGELKAENARLKAECQARQAENSVLAVECDRLKAEVERLKEFISKIPAEARIKVLTDAHKGRWDGCPPSDEYIKQMRANEEGKQP